MLRKLKSTEVKRPTRVCPNDKSLTVHLIISSQMAGGMMGKVVLSGRYGVSLQQRTDLIPPSLAWSSSS